MSRILIVDDDAQFRRTLRLALVSRGYEVSDASGAQEAEDMVAGNPRTWLCSIGICRIRMEFKRAGRYERIPTYRSSWSREIDRIPKTLL